MKPNRPLNLLANYVGTGCSFFIQLLLVPVYIGLLGVEAWGLVGFYLTMLAVLQVLDIGLSPALSRELARRTVDGATAPGTASMVKTLETIYWVVGLSLGLLITGGSSVLANSWVNAQGLPPGDVTRAIALMGLSFAFQWPISFYTSGLQGLQRQTLTAVINAATAAVFGVGAVVLLILWPDLDVFFGWRAFTALVTVAVLRHMLLTSPGVRQPGEYPRVQLDSLAAIWKFSLGMTGITLTAMIITQVDKIVVTKLLALDQLGYYSLAISAASVLPYLAAPLFVAVFPMLSQGIVKGDQEQLRRQFHLSTQLTALIVFPAATMLVFFAHDVLAVWTGTTPLADSAAGALSLLALGALLNSIMAIPYALQLSYGWTQLSLIINLVLIAITVPYSIYATSRWGLAGAASTSVVLNGTYVLIGAPAILRRLMPGEGLRWLFRDVTVPLITVAGTAATFLLFPPGDGRLILFLKLCLGATAAYLAALLATGVARARVRELLAAWYRSRRR